MFRDEVIGRNVRVIDSSNPTLEGLSGQVLDDTRSTLLIRVGNRHKRVLKSQCTFSVCLSGHDRIIAGAELMGAPYERV